MNENNPPVSALRQRMLEDMQLRKLGAKTQSSDNRAVKNLSDFLHHSPASPGAEDLRRFQLHLANNANQERTVALIFAKPTRRSEEAVQGRVLSLPRLTGVSRARCELRNV